MITKTVSFVNESHYSFRQGFFAPFRAFGYLLTNFECLKLAAAPWFINFFFVLPCIYFIMTLLIFPFIMGFLPDPDTWYFAAIRWVSGLFVSIFLFVLGLASALVGAIVIGAPLHDLLGERIEKQELKKFPQLLAPESTIFDGVQHAIREVIKRVALTIPLFIVALLIGFIPFIGPPIATFMNFFIAVMFLTLDAFCFPMDRRSKSLGDKITWLRSNVAFSFGFGLPMFLIPCGIFLVPPLAAVAGTLMYCDFEKEQLTKALAEAPESPEGSESPKSES